MCDDQAGVITRSQALAAGLGVQSIRRRLASGRWQRLHPGVYATFSGCVPRAAMLWACILAVGEGAVLSHETAAELVGLADAGTMAARPVHITIPVTRRVTAPAGVVVHHSRRVGDAAHPAHRPPRTTVEETTLDLVESAATLETALDWVFSACGRRLTTPPRLRTAMARRSRMRRRAELTALLADVEHGCHSALERRYLHDVERAHGLPRGQRQVGRTVAGVVRFDDVRYPDQGVIVELDGRAAHPEERRHRDLRRDNRSTLAGDHVLRYGWHDVAGRPCAVAAQVARVLGRIPRRCRRPGCVIVKDNGRKTTPDPSRS